MLIKQLLTQVQTRLTAVGIPEAKLEAELILGHVCRKNRTQLFLASDLSLSSQELNQCQNALARRCSREPLAYIIGEQEFWSLPFKVTPDVLIPRPETELLLESAIGFASIGENIFKGPVLDMGTGSGIIAVVLALELPGTKIFAIDKSPAALGVAKENALTHGVAKQILFLAADLFSGVREGEKFSLIVTNPPYVVRKTISTLQPEVRMFEPHLALDGGEDGLDTLRLLAANLRDNLAPGGAVFMEIGFDQEETVLELFKDLPFLEDLQVLRDYAGLARIFSAKRKKIE